MEMRVREWMEQTVKNYFPVANLREMLLAFIDDKSKEITAWSEMTLLVHRMLGGANPHIERLAALTELIILSLDIMDDLQDQDNLEKTWMKYPTPLVLNAMLGLLMSAYAELSALARQGDGHAYPDPGQLSALVASAINGQHIDLTLSVQTEHQYVEMVHQKSCMLIRIAFYMGLGGLPGEQAAADAEKLYALADHIGLVAQIRNDMNDVLRTDVKNDLLGKKRTLPILFMLSDPDEAYPPLLKYYSGELSLEAFLEEIDDCLAYIVQSGCISYCEFIQQLQLDRARTLFKELQLHSPWKEQFHEMFESMA